MHTFTVSTHKLACIIAALECVSPSGGGSEPYSIARELRAALPDGVEFSDGFAQLQTDYVGNVLRDAAECGAIVPNADCAAFHGIAVP